MTSLIEEENVEKIIDIMNKYERFDLWSVFNMFNISEDEASKKIDIILTSNRSDSRGALEDMFSNHCIK